MKQILATGTIVPFDFKIQEIFVASTLVPTGHTDTVPGDFGTTSTLSGIPAGPVIVYITSPTDGTFVQDTDFSVAGDQITFMSHTGDGINVSVLYSTIPDAPSVLKLSLRISEFVNSTTVDTTERLLEITKHDIEWRNTIRVLNGVHYKSTTFSFFVSVDILQGYKVDLSILNNGVGIGNTSTVIGVAI